jgi:hypothetical protein
MDPLDVILVVFAAVLAAYVVLLATLRAIRPVRRAGTYLSDNFAAPFSSHFQESDRDRRFRRLDQEVRRELGDDGTTDDRERAEVVEAAVATQRIAVLNRHLRKSASQCLATHWAIAAGLGCREMAEAARHPLSSQLRQRVVDLSELLGQHLLRYPYLIDEPDLIRLQVGIRWIAPTCVTCPYYLATVAEAPRVCPTVRAMSSTSARRSADRVVEGELVDDDCDGEFK